MATLLHKSNSRSRMFGQNMKTSQ